LFRKQLARLQKAKATRKEIDEFLAAREQWKRLVQEEMNQENL